MDERRRPLGPSGPARPAELPAAACRAYRGELVQIDGSDHAWFEDRGPRCTLLVYVEDATGRLMELCFADTESTFDYFHATRRYLERHGKSMAFYSRYRSSKPDISPWGQGGHFYFVLTSRTASFR